MPGSTSSLIDIVVTPRFEVFYALQALHGSSADRLHSWRRETERRLAHRTRSSLLRVAPSPLMWPLLADALRDTQPAPSFIEMTAELRGMKDADFQRAVLSGVFKSPGGVENLLSGKSTLWSVIAGETAIQGRLLSLLGLLPFSSRGASIVAFNRLIDDPSAYRNEVVNALASFWASGFAQTWGTLEPQMRDRARALRQAATTEGPGEFARSTGLPIVIGPDAVTSVRGTTRVEKKDVAGIHVIPSVFNTAGLWAAYVDAGGRTRFFIPHLDPTLSPDTRTPLKPALVFAALGDTTRYAIASTIARKAMTSAQLAHAFEVSKPTISHHVQLLRTAGLLEETHTESGILLSLNRRVLERTSGAAAREMFSDDGPAPTIRRTRIPNKS